MFIISNGVETRYFSNNDSELLKSHMFYWSDKQNNRINTLQSFAESFMRPCQLAKMISRYMIINETDRILMAMRPYRIYGGPTNKRLRQGIMDMYRIQLEVVRR